MSGQRAVAVDVDVCVVCAQNSRDFIDCAASRLRHQCVDEHSKHTAQHDKGNEGVVAKGLLCMRVMV